MNLLARYRRECPFQTVSFAAQEQQVGCFFQWAAKPPSGCCSCEKHEGKCALVQSWIGQCYDCADPRLHKIYQTYSKLAIESPLADCDIADKLASKMAVLGVEADEACKVVLERIVKNYLKHTEYYKRGKDLTGQNELYMWFAIGVFYHAGQTAETTVFWVVDMLMNSLGGMNRGSHEWHVRKTVDLLRDYFNKWFFMLIERYAIRLEQLVGEWMSELLMGSMDVHAIGFMLGCLLKVGWNYVYKVILSYFQKQMERLESQGLLVAASTTREDILDGLINNKQEWPIIFCNANNFKFDRVNLSTVHTSTTKSV